MDQMQEFLAKQAIREQLYRYCRSMDRRDDPLGIGIFTEDCHMDYGLNFQGTGREFVEWAHKAHEEAYVMTSHQVTNMLIELSADGTHAASETYLHTLQLTHPDKRGRVYQLQVAARYLDQWVLLDGTWRIARRQYVQDIANLWECARPFPRFGGTADESDPSYDLLRGLRLR